MKAIKGSRFLVTKSNCVLEATRLRTLKAVSQPSLFEPFWPRGRSNGAWRIGAWQCCGQESLTAEVLDILREMRPSCLQTLVAWYVSSFPDDESQLDTNGMSQCVQSNQVVSRYAWLLVRLSIFLCYCVMNWDWQALPLLKASHFRVVCALGACPSLTKLELMLHVPVSWRLICIWSMLPYTHTKIHGPMHPCTNAYTHTYIRIGAKCISHRSHCHPITL